MLHHDQTRVMSAFENDTRKAKLAASILMTLPGNPFIYYGEEIGMRGAKALGDEALRTPMKWTKKKAKGQTVVYEASFKQPKSTNVETESKSKDSLLSHYKKVIGWRNKNIALSDGTISPYAVDDSSVLAWTRDYKSKHALVLHNLGSQKVVVEINQSGSVKFKKIIEFSKKGSKLKGNKVTIPAYGSIILK
jgi:alpha-amylase